MTVEELLRDLKIPRAPDRHHHARSGWWQTDCPFCSPQARRWRLGVNLRDGRTSCWVCGRVPLTPTLARITGRESREISRLTAELTGGRGKPLTAAERAADARIGDFRPPGGRGELLSCHRKFLRSRGFDPAEVAARWGVEGIGPLGGRYAYRIFIPVLLGSQLVSWTTRAVADGDGLRYDSAPAERESVPHRSLLYGEEQAGHAVLIVESPVDVWAAGPGSVATFGTAYTRAQVLRLAKFPARYVCFDSGERAGDRAARKLVRDLEVFPGDTYRVELKTGKDPSRVSKQELKSLRSLLT